MEESACPIPICGSLKQREGRGDPMNARLDEIAAWRPAPSGGLESAANECGYPTVIHRTPSRLVEKCEIAFDAGLLLAALSLVVTIPDVCAKAVGMKYTDWCVKYLDLPNTGEKMNAERKDGRAKTRLAMSSTASRREVHSPPQTSTSCAVQWSMRGPRSSRAKERITAPTKSSGYASKATSAESSRAMAIPELVRKT